MKIVFIVTGKTNHPLFSDIEDEYRKRLKHYIQLEQIVVHELKNTKNLTQDEQRIKEGELILKQIDPTDDVILLDEKGKTFSSIKFSSEIEKRMQSSVKRVVFVVGGPYGFSEAVYKRANSMLSLSAMTFSHQMIRMIFLEQLYRAMTILKGEPYHHE
jgi:23S rRNA (pseudouridine1915-N3)-methyltransferase